MVLVARKIIFSQACSTSHAFLVAVWPTSGIYLELLLNHLVVISDCDDLPWAFDVVVGQWVAEHFHSSLDGDILPFHNLQTGWVVDAELVKNSFVQLHSAVEVDDSEFEQITRPVHGLGCLDQAHSDRKRTDLNCSDLSQEIRNLDFQLS